jgi:hypothetical protein
LDVRGEGLLRDSLDAVNAEIPANKPAGRAVVAAAASNMAASNASAVLSVMTAATIFSMLGLLALNSSRVKTLIVASLFGVSDVPALVTSCRTGIAPMAAMAAEMSFCGVCS